MPMAMDLTPDTLDITVYAGDRGDFKVHFKDNDNNSVDVSDRTWAAHIRKSRGAIAYTALTVNDSDAATGIIIVEIPGSVTAALAESPWDKANVWDLQCTFSAPGSGPLTVLQGTLYSKRDVTR